MMPERFPMRLRSYVRGQSSPLSALTVAASRTQDRARRPRRKTRNLPDVTHVTPQIVLRSRLHGISPLVTANQRRIRAVRQVCLA
jgi:hypothetical protein